MDEQPVRKSLTPAAAEAKIESYCAWQDRAQQEVRDKLYTWGLHSSDVENIIVRLIEQNFLNEERFALAYATGKFRQKQWGKIKIRQGLKLKRVSDPLIKKALLAIDLDDYRETLRQILEKKAALVTEKHPLKRRYRLQQYAYGRGFETALTDELLKDSGLANF